MTSTKHAAVHRTGAASQVWVLGDEVSIRAQVAGTDFFVIDVTCPPGSGVPPHAHASPEIFRVLEGALRVWLEVDGRAQEVDAGPGDVVTIPAHAPHGYRNAGPAPVKFMAIADSSLVAFFKAAASNAAPAGPPSDEAIANIMALSARHGITMLAA